VFSVPLWCRDRAPTQATPIEEIMTTTSRTTTEDDITTEVLKRFDATTNPRLKQIMQSLVKHAHAFVRDVELTEEEWFAAIQFLTDTGHMCTGRRQEFILLSDTLGVSMLVDLISHRKPQGATESTVFGPFYREASPEMPAGGNIAPRDLKGTPTIVSGRVTNLHGQPIANAVLDVWQSNSEGFYDAQLGDDELHMRGIFRTDADGRYLIRTTRPLHYPIPTDGPVGKMLEATNRHPWRPGHIHFKVSAEGYEPVTTHLFDSTDEYLDSDTVCGVKDSLIVEFKQQTTQDETARRLGVPAPYMTAEYDFVLKDAQA
jgi:protocatechuate 3,4-dioxygenase beta subunit